MTTQLIERQRSQLWGPPLEKTYNLPTSAKFTGEDLANMDKDIRAKPHLSSEGIVNFLAKKMNMRLAIFALTALNQFYIKGVNLRDINSVTIVQDTQNKAKMGEGRGQGHMWYLIDWIKAPEFRPDSATTQTSNIEQKQVSAPHHFVTQANRDAARRTIDTRDEQRRKAYDRAHQEEYVLKLDYIVRENEKAKVEERKTIDPLIMADSREEANGMKRPTYDECISLYERASKSGLLFDVYHSSGNKNIFSFVYKKSLGGAPSQDAYSVIDLDDGMVRIGDKVRFLNYGFWVFLQMKMEQFQRDLGRY